MKVRINVRKFKLLYWFLSSKENKMRHARAFRWFGTFCIPIILGFALSSCLFPEEFEVQIRINKDGTFTFTYEGILTFVLAKAEEVKKGKLSAKIENDLRKLEEEFKRDPRYKKVDYVGHAQYRVVFKDSGTLKNPYYFFEKSEVQTNPILISIIPKGGNMVEITGYRLDENIHKQLKALNMRLKGTLKVTTDGNVKQHNAKSTPSFFGFVGSYSWEIKSLEDPAPRMVIQF
jgi:hypothetical protein